MPKTINQMKNLETLVLLAIKITHISEPYELKKLKKIYLNVNPIDPKDIEVLRRTYKKTEITFEKFYSSSILYNRPLSVEALRCWAVEAEIMAGHLFLQL